MSEEMQYSLWQLLPDSVLLYIFTYLDSKEVINCGQTCKTWNRVSYDEFLWRDMFYKDWKIPIGTSRKPDKMSWFDEYKRLKYHTPMIATEILYEHTNQVLHVSFSHNGEMFATSSKDGFIKVWNSSYPASIKYSVDMKNYGWKYTQFSQFNESDTLLLVSGVHTGLNNSNGEIVVFSVDGEFLYQSKVANKPYDIFGTWYNDIYLLSGQLLWLGQMVSSSVLWLNYAYQETEAPNKSVVTKLYKFYNRNASSIRTIIIANCVSNDDDDELDTNDQIVMESVSHVRGNPFSHTSINLERQQGTSASETSQNVAPNNKRDRRLRRITDPDNLDDLGRSILLEYDYSDDESDDFDDLMMAENFHQAVLPTPAIFAPNPDVVEASRDRRRGMMQLGDGDVLDSRDKYLIFTTGFRTYTPHQIGFKRIKPFMFRDKINMNLNDRLAEQQDRSGQHVEHNYEDELSVQHMFDKVDHLIDLHGHIIGMALSPDHRYLYVNNRPWPKDCQISDPMHPPPIAQEIDIHVIDLTTLQEVGVMLRSHKAYTSNDECFFIFLDVSNDFVASGAEDQHGYLWDRHYGICLSRYKHNDVVNSVAFNPVDSEMLVTASDDHTLKIWRSRNRANEIKEKAKV
uniref:F-box domain-containing protein n=1 Tax=Strigamia maritima TaxID=126957 RepID=T1JEH6_STRMM